MRIHRHCFMRSCFPIRRFFYLKSGKSIMKQSRLICIHGTKDFHCFQVSRPPVWHFVSHSPSFYISTQKLDVAISQEPAGKKVIPADYVPSFHCIGLAGYSTDATLTITVISYIYIFLLLKMIAWLLFNSHIILYTCMCMMQSSLYLSCFSCVYIDVESVWRK